jgi:chromosome segregation ATPase
MLLIIYFFCLLSFGTSNALPTQEYQSNIVTRTLSWLWYTFGMISETKVNEYTTSLATALKADLVKIEKEQAALKEEYKVCRDSMRENMEKEMKAIRSKLQANEFTISAIEHGLKEIEKAKNSNGIDLGEAFLRIQAIENKITFLKKNYEESTANLKAHNKFLDDQAEELTTLKESIKTAHQDIAEANSWIKKSNLRIDKIEKDIEEDKKVKADALRRVEIAIRRTKKLKEENETLRHQNEQLKKQLYSSDNQKEIADEYIV